MTSIGKSPETRIVVEVDEKSRNGESLPSSRSHENQRMVESTVNHFNGSHVMVEYMLWVIAIASFAFAFYANLHYYHN